MIEPALRRGASSYLAKLNARSMKLMLLLMLREWLYARAVGQDAPLPDSCPALDVEACFNADCPIAARVGLKAASSPEVGPMLQSLSCIDAARCAASAGAHAASDTMNWLWIA